MTDCQTGLPEPVDHVIPEILEPMDFCLLSCRFPFQLP